MATLRITIPSRLDAVAPAAHAVRRCVEQAGHGPLAAAEIELCVAEAANNCVRHAYAANPDGGPVEIACEAGPGRIVIAVTDYGTPRPAGTRGRRPDFDPADIDALPEGGMGLFLIEQVMTRIDYTAGPAGNTLTMERLVPALLAGTAATPRDGAD